MYSRVMCSATRGSLIAAARPSTLVRRSMSTAGMCLDWEREAGSKDADDIANTVPALEPKSRMHGSYHWNFERALSVVSVPLLIAPFIVGSHPLVDLGLGVVIPLHSHIGFGALLSDYAAPHKYPVAGRIASATLYAATGLVLYGCYQFNTNDVGITEFVKRLWTGKQ
ncbi:membrane anchor subunit of succinate dehydrogenase, Sdh4 [Geranomyces michiganensis]|nr:membrane anchor subunit of succinate dehydrogenase, Sdh4 [Geranomyces michiganensis]